MGRFFSMSCLDSDGDYDLVLSNNGVLYIRFMRGFGCAITPMLCSDGTPMTYEKWLEIRGVSVKERV